MLATLKTLAARLARAFRRDEHIVRLEVPDLSLGDLHVEVRGGMLVISGERRDARDRLGRGYRLHERVYGRFERRVRLPREVWLSAPKAKLRNGVLTVRLERSRPPQARLVPVR